MFRDIWVSILMGLVKVLPFSLSCQCTARHPQVAIPRWEFRVHLRQSRRYNCWPPHKHVKSQSAMMQCQASYCRRSHLIELSPALAVAPPLTLCQISPVWKKVGPISPNERMFTARSLTKLFWQADSPRFIPTQHVDKETCCLCGEMALTRWKSTVVDKTVRRGALQ